MIRCGTRHLTLVIATLLCGCAGGPAPNTQPEQIMIAGPLLLDTLVGGARVYLETEVDRPAIALPGPEYPGYPVSLRRSGIHGRVEVAFVVDTAGAVERSTILPISSNHPDFTAAVREALPRIRYEPAIRAGKRVRTWAQQWFEFTVGAP